jgi:hypothetical protein
VFQCRPVKRVKKSFQIPIAKGIIILETAKRRLSGIAKRFKYALSHPLGKIEIVGLIKGQIVFKIHSAKYSGQTGAIFMRPVDDVGGWLPDDLELESNRKFSEMNGGKEADILPSVFDQGTDGFLLAEPDAPPGA